MKYADIIIDNRTDSTDMPYTYGYPEDMELRAGDKVYVPFARSRNLREGYVLAADSRPEEGIRSRIRQIDHVDENVSLTPEIMRTCVWMRRRCVCRYIDAVRCFLPAGKKRKRQIMPDPAEENDDVPQDPEKKLTGEQEQAVSEVTEAIRAGEHERFLLRGVTGSGKTEVYIRAAEAAAGEGRSVIILVPEISLTPQIIERFAAVFGEEDVAVMHSRLSQGERYAQWDRIRSGKVRIVIGARSAVFAPLENIGLIVIDEEHETTYKSDATPKYDAVEVALKRVSDRDHKGVLLLGSATPSVASSYRAEEGIYRTLSMRKRYNETSLPAVSVVDMRQELRDGNRSMLSRELAGRMQEELADGRQVMLLLNRRGYATFVSCRECGHVAVCPVCGLSLTYHSSTGRLSCHFCGHEEPAPKVCPECGSRFIRYFGSGTEKAEETIAELFPDFPADRIDLDSVSRKGELKRRLKDFGRGKTRILIGTQMIAKGLDFRNVGLVGILSADLSLNIPDYRSPERTFQLVTQAAGRAGRGERRGSVVIQTYQPEHYAVRFAAEQDYEGFYQAELNFRRLMQYPPFSDLIQVVFTSKERGCAEEGALSWYEYLQQHLPEGERKNVFQPQEAYMGKIRDQWRFSLMMRCPRGERKKFTTLLRDLKERDMKRRVKYIAVVDINPYSFA